MEAGLWGGGVLGSWGGERRAICEAKRGRSLRDGLWVYGPWFRSGARGKYSAKMGEYLDAINISHGEWEIFP